MKPTNRQALPALLLLFAINFMNFYDRQVVGAIGERLKGEWQLTDSQLAGLTTVFILLYGVIGLPLGRLSDTVSRKRILAGGISLWSMFTALSGIAQSFGAMIVYRLGVGVGEASAAPAATSLIGDLFSSKQRSRAISVFMLGVPLGIGASSFISGLVTQATGSGDRRFLSRRCRDSSLPFSRCACRNRREVRQIQALPPNRAAHLSRS